jgi:hypothetical protein
MKGACFLGQKIMLVKIKHQLAFSFGISRISCENTLEIPRTGGLKLAVTERFWKWQNRQRLAYNAFGSPESDSGRVFYASPPSSPGGNAHECHSPSSLWVSQNHLPHFVQRTVAGL